MRSRPLRPFSSAAGQQRRDGIARMAGAMGEADKGVVEIEIADHHAVGENRKVGLVLTPLIRTVAGCLAVTSLASLIAILLGPAA